MAVDASGTPTSPDSIPTYATSADAPSGKGFNAAMAAIQTALSGRWLKTLFTTTGDIAYASSASTPARLGIGSTGNVLTVAGGLPTWTAPAAGYPFASRTASIAIVYAAGASSIPTGASGASLLIDTIPTNTDGYVLSSNRVIVPRTGYYRFTMLVQWASGTVNTLREIYLNKLTTGGVANGQVGIVDGYPAATGLFYQNLSGVVFLSANEMLQPIAVQGTAGSLNVQAGAATFPDLVVEFLGA